MKTDKLATTLLAATTTLTSFTHTTMAERVAGQPNVIIVFTDDQGYSDLGCFGAKEFTTPHIDQMAKEGVRFIDFYVAATVCTPSRGALLTGCYPKRIGLHKGVLFPHSKTGLNPDEITIAELLKQKGYATGCFGKWHLGHHNKFMPTNQGFDRYFGLPYSNDMAHVWRYRNKKKKPNDNYPKIPLIDQEKTIEEEPDQRFLTKRYTEAACTFIRKNRDNAFFVYLPHSMPHIPLYASDDFKGKTKRGLYGDVINEIDWSVGQILKTLKDIKQDKNTLVIFTSDNGPWLKFGKTGGTALPLRDGKGTTWEGGQRVPTVMRWPGKLPAGKKCNKLATTMDLLPTIAGLTGAHLPKNHIIDGKDIWQLMTNPETEKSPHDAFYYYAKNGKVEAIRSGKWKLHIAKISGWNKKKDGPFKPFLIDLNADIGETTNLADQHPEIVKKLTSQLKAFDKNLTETARPVGKL